MTDDNLPIVPPRLFKYLARTRVDVIENLRIRFTSFLATNDIFEVRRTFKKLVGPKFDQLLSEQAVNVDPEETAIEELKKAFGLSDEQARVLAKQTLIQQFGPDYKTTFQKMTADMAKLVVPTLNRDENIEKVLMNVGGQLVALSLSEDEHSSTMWTHYGVSCPSDGIIHAHLLLPPPPRRRRRAAARQIRPLIFARPQPRALAMLKNTQLETSAN